ncbi:MAG: leucine-rich repeat domain-containing protein [Egibacteraceae bacterium]
MNLQEQELVELPREIGEAIPVQNLDLRGNQLTELPAEIGQLANLRTLYLHDNQLTGLPCRVRQSVRALAASCRREPSPRAPASARHAWHRPAVVVPAQPLQRRRSSV